MLSHHGIDSWNPCQEIALWWQTCDYRDVLRMPPLCPPWSTKKRVVQSITPTWLDLFRALVADATMNHGMHSYHQKPESGSPCEYSKKHGLEADPDLNRISCRISFHEHRVPPETPFSPSSYIDNSGCFGVQS